MMKFFSARAPEDPCGRSTFIPQNLSPARWWFSGPIDTGVLRCQLDWLATNGFGGVELAWVYPLQQRTGPRWLDRAWQRLVVLTKRYCVERGLGCDFTFGTLWPFGGSFVLPEDSSQTFDGLSPQRLEQSWEHGTTEPGRVINHLSRRLFEKLRANHGKGPGKSPEA